MTDDAIDPERLLEDEIDPDIAAVSDEDMAFSPDNLTGGELVVNDGPKNVGGRPRNPTSVAELAERKMIYGSMLKFFQDNRRIQEQLQRVDVTDSQTLKVKKGDDLMVQVVKQIAMELLRTDDVDKRIALLGKFWTAVARADQRKMDVNDQILKIALANFRRKGDKKADGEEMTPDVVAQQLRESGMTEEEIKAHMGTSYPGEP